jgi:hypothetical protein
MNRSIALLFYFCWGFLLYGYSLQYGFLLDDQAQVLANPQVQELSKIFMSFANSTMAMTEGVGGIYYKPVMMMAYNLLWNLGSGSAIAFHVFQLVLHILNAFLIFCLFQKIFGEKKNLWAFFAGALFLCHTANSEAVLMIADLQEPLYTFFGLLALLTLGSSRFPWIAALFFLLSLLSKESGVLYLAIAVVYCYFFARDRVKWVLAAGVIAVIAYLGLRLGLAGLSTVSANNMKIMRADLGTRLLTMPRILIHYVQLFFFPINVSLTQDWVVSSAAWREFWWPLIIVIGLGLGLIYYYLKKPSGLFLFFAVWCLMGLVLHLQIVPLDGTVSDRWLYFPIIGAIGMVLVSRQGQIGKFPFLTAVVLILSMATFMRILEWKTPLTLFRADLRKDPTSFYLNNNIGLEYLAQKKFVEALPYFTKTIEVSPKGSREWLVAWRNLGAAYLELKEYSRAEECFKISLADGDVKSYRAMAMVLQAQQRNEDLKIFLDKALVRFPEDAFLRHLQRP